MHDGLKVGFLNIRSIFTGFYDFKYLVEHHDIDIMFLCETWLSDGDDSARFNIPEYQLIRRDRAGRGGGVAAFVKNNLTVEEVNFNFRINEALEFLIIKVKIKNQRLAFAVFYRPPNTNFNNFISDLDTIFSNLYPTVNEIFCLGDFNVNLMNLDNPLTSLFENYNCQQIINEPTRITANTSTLLDAIFVSDCSLVNECGTISTDHISDHKMVYCSLKLSKIPVEPKIIQYRCYKYFDVNNFLKDMHDLPWNNILYDNNIDNKIKIFNELILFLFNIHAPIKQSRITKPRAPWLTANLKIFMKQRDTALQKFKRTRNNNDWVNYKQLRNLTLTMVRRAKREYLDSLCLQERNTRKTWGALKNFNITSSKNYCIPNSLADPNNINNFFGAFLQNISDCSNKVNFYNDNLYNDNVEKFNFDLAEISDIHNILNSIQTNATGVDEVSPLMLKYCSPFIDKYITHIINCCMEINYFPDLWKISIGKPLPKTSNPASFNDLRIISILPVLSKIYEKVLFFQMYEFCTRNEIIPDVQCGFRKNFSTSVALINVIDDVVRASDKKLNSALILLDFSKAFDTINHQLLVSKLHFYGFQKESCLTIKSYLSNRYQKIFSDNKYSEQVRILSGVPQGSILGPLLFLIYTSDILRSLKYCKVQAYADDTQIYYCFDIEENINAEALINEDLQTLTQLATAHNLKLNPSKSYLMLFGNKNKVHYLKDNLNIVLSGVKLGVVESAKNLGIILDSELRFRDHLKKLNQKSYMALKILYNNRHILSFKLKKTLCESLVLSNFNYCDFVYGHCLDNISKSRIQKVQNACARFIFGLRKYDHISHTFLELNWLKMDSRRLLHFCTFIYKILNEPNSPVSVRERLVPRCNVHSVNIRHRGRLTQPHHQSALFQRSFTYNAVRAYNSLPNNLIGLSVQLFKIKYKKHLLNLQT